MKNLSTQKTAFYRVTRWSWRPMPVILFLTALLLFGAILPACSTTIGQSGNTPTPGTTAAPSTQQLYTQVTSKQPDITNPLTTTSSFMEQIPPDCTFSNGALHIKSTHSDYYIWCISLSTSVSNFAFQVDMSTISGDSGGVMFRIDSTIAKYYRFEIGQDGSYSLYLSTSKNTPDQLLLSGSSPAIKTGINQVNTITVIANGSSLSFFVNSQLVASKSNTTLTAGNVGLIAHNLSSPFTEVAFNNLKIWSL